MGNLIVSIIRFLSPELAHYITIKLLKLGLVNVFFKKIHNSPLLRQVIWNLEFNNPIGLAAGFDKNGEVVDEALNLGFGFVEIGTVTPKAQFGNEKPRLFRLSRDKALINHLGFNNQGMEKVKKRLAIRYENKSSVPGIVGINIGKNSYSKDTTKDYLDCLKVLGPYTDYIVINISSPNTPGLRSLQNRENLENLIISIKNIKKKDNKINNKPLFIKISPDLNNEQKKDIALTSLAQGIDGIIISNTTLERYETLIDNNKIEVGGLSGSPLFLPSTLLLKEMYNLTGGKIPLIGLGGISSGRDAYEKIKAGASLVQLYTGLIFEGPSIVNKINKELVYLLQIDGYTNISEVIGIESS